MDTAPFHADLADGPDDGQAWWIMAEDGVRLRVGAFNQRGENGTVLLFPGRTEYVEKYGRAARQLADCGYATFVIDWRGQGLADRLIDDPMSGHVHHFRDYQLDVAAMLDAARALGLPRPYHLLAHSMGGCIGLRAAMEGLPVASCIFSGPMWGIHIKDTLRPVAWSVSWGSRRIGMGHAYAPGTTPDSYVLSEPFETNKLTNDPDMYQYMIDQTRACPELGLGGPSLHWLHEALKETRELSRRPSPDLPCLTFAGTAEEIVDIPRIEARIAEWPGAQMEWIEGGKHEVMMEDRETRNRIFDRMCRFLDTHSGDLPPNPPSCRAPRAATGGQAL